MKASDFDKRFEAGDDMTDMLDFSKATRPELTAKRVNVDFPDWMVKKLDKEANRLGITRQSLIKIWVSNQLDNHVS
jgi:CopG antitoxin of type II toxin-antitoxin system